MGILVLNSSYEPINVTSLKKGYRLVYKNKAEIIEHIPENPIITPTDTYKRPVVIRLLKYVNVPYRKVDLTRENILKRDNYKCVYCGSIEKLTIDHIIPRAKGGGNYWNNLITSCGSCNLNKGHMDVEDFLIKNNYKMSHQPFVPNYVYFIHKMDDFHESWNSYIHIGG